MRLNPNISLSVNMQDRSTVAFACHGILLTTYDQMLFPSLQYPVFLSHVNAITRQTLGSSIPASSNRSAYLLAQVLEESIPFRHRQISQRVRSVAFQSFSGRSCQEDQVRYDSHSMGSYPSYLLFCIVWYLHRACALVTYFCIGKLHKLVETFHTCSSIMPLSSST